MSGQTQSKNRCILGTVQMIRKWAGQDASTCVIPTSGWIINHALVISVLGQNCNNIKTEIASPHHVPLSSHMLSQDIMIGNLQKCCVPSASRNPTAWNLRLFMSSESTCCRSIPKHSCRGTCPGTSDTHQKARRWESELRKIPS